MTTRRRSPVRTDPEVCGVEEQPVGYTCTRAAKHTGLHMCKSGEGEVIARWSSRAEWHGPVLHGVRDPRAALTLCGQRAGTVAHPISYESRHVRCPECRALLRKGKK